MAIKILTLLALSAAVLGSGVAGCSQSLEDRRTRGAVVGGVAGAAIGSLFGGGSGKVLTIGAGAVLGSIAGSEIAGN